MSVAVWAQIGHSAERDVTVMFDTVLTTIVGRALELSEADGGTIFEYDEGTEEFSPRATVNADEGQSAILRATRLRRGYSGTAASGSPSRTAAARILTSFEQSGHDRHRSAEARWMASSERIATAG